MRRFSVGRPTYVSKRIIGPGYRETNMGADSVKIIDMERTQQMPQIDKEAQLLRFHKAKTNIAGFDNLLFDGLDISSYLTVIFIRGGEGSKRALFGLQMIYGIAQSIKDILSDDDFEPYKPLYISTVLDERFLNDSLLDMAISSSITLLRNKRLSSRDKLSDTFSRTMFDLKEKRCGRFPGSIYDSLPADIEKNVDELICEEAIYYSNRTNSLHFRTRDSVSDSRNILFKRKFDSISEYFGYKKNHSADTERDRVSCRRLMQSISEYTSYNFLPISIKKQPIENSLSESELPYLLAIDIPNQDKDSLHEMNDLIERLRAVGADRNGHGDDRKGDNETHTHKVLIVTLPSGDGTLPDYLADMIIQLEPTIINDYHIDRLSIVKSKNQSAALGWHQYKYRDYGFEVYPSLHRLFQVRRYLQRAMVYTHSDVISDTFQQFLMGCDSGYSAYSDFCKTRELIPDAYVDALYPEERTDYKTSHLISRILLNEGSLTPVSNRFVQPNLVDAHIHRWQEGVTAIIGNGNTFKRFLTFGSVFSCCINKEHTLILLLNKDERMIRRRLSCPARIKRDRERKECKECYGYIHFMNIMMGCITAEEFIYFLQLQFNTAFNDGCYIKRVIIDDLQILDFCFPMLKGNTLFISALATLCKERDITLHILCDKNCSSVNALKTIADNVICTDRDKDGKLLIYVDRFAGYQNTPSKVYGASVRRVSKLFECGEKNGVTSFVINGKEMEDVRESSMNDYWFQMDRRGK